jgi:beta-glucosidase
MNISPFKLLNKKSIFLLSFFSSITMFSQNGYNFEIIDSKIDKLLSQMSIQDKIGQTCQITLDAILKTNSNGGVLEPNQIDQTKLDEAIFTYKIGSVLNVSSHTLAQEEWKRFLNTIHKPYKDKKTKIPVLYGVDAIHGVNYTIGATLFPQELGLAATWNRTLAKEFGRIVSYELRASGIPWNFSPVLDLGRQPLWSRLFETLGEDPYLASEMGVEIVKGYQGNDLSNKYNSLACLKHFVGYSYPVSGRDRTPAWIPEQTLHELYLPPFENAVKNGALTVMVNSGELNGVPGHANYNLLTEILKNKWGFMGFCVTDWEDILMLETVHSVVKNQEEAIALAFNSGIDMSMVPNSPMYKDYCKSFEKALQLGLINESRLNDAVKRILRTKFILDLFENPYDDKVKYPNFGSKEFKNKARESAAESITLLKNENSILPLSDNNKILVCGPAAASLNILNGAWTHTWQGIDTNYNTKNCLTIVDAIKSSNKNTTLYEKGVSLFLENQWETSKFDNIDAYKDKIKDVDFVIVCLGEMPGTEKPGDIRSLNMSDEQMELVKIAKSFNKKVILVLVEGRPRIINKIVNDCDAIIQCYLPGDYGALALADIIFGKINPSGKLPYTYPKYDGIIEHYDHKKSEARSGKTFGFDAYDPQWDFGHGLSYTNFEYSNLSLSKNSFSENESVSVSVTVKNTGKLPGKEVVQLFISDLVASSVPRGKALKNFEKITLDVNEEKTISFVISDKDINFVNSKLEKVTEKGFFEIQIQNLKSLLEYK